MSIPNLKVVDSSNNDAEDVVPEVHEIFELRNFSDDSGRTVIGKYPLHSIDNITFMGSFMVGTNMGPVRLNMEFPEGYSIDECFEQFDAIAQETVQKAQEEAQEHSRIVTPDQLKRSGIIVP